MPLPLPPAPLGRHCTAIFDKTLYAYTENGFYTLPLSHGANWTKIANSVVMTSGSVCVHAGQSTGDESLYLVGGDVPAAADLSSGYNGLQRWKFAQKKWEVMPLADKTLFNLTHHGATYLSESSEIFIYAGNRFELDYIPSSEAFLVSVNDPFWVSSMPTGLAPPLLFPVVESMSGNTGLVTGGDAGMTHMYSYSPTDGWKDLPTHLDSGLPVGSGSARIVDGADGSKQLVTFDFSQSPTKVSIISLANDTATTPPSTSQSTSRLRTRATLPYNSTFAPSDTRKDFSIASDDQYIVISGGGPESDPLCIFDYKENSWLNATSLLAAEQKPLNPSSSASSSTTKLSLESIPTASSSVTVVPESISTTSNAPSFSSSAASSATLAATAVTTGLSTSTKLLFIILGVVVAAIVILGTAFVILRCKRKKREAARKNEKPPNNNNLTEPKSPSHSVMSFKDRGASFMKEAGGTKSAIFTRSRSLKSSNNKRRKSELNHPDIANLPRGAVLGPAAGTTLEMQPTTQRGSGWSRYFSGNSTTNLVGNGVGGGDGSDLKRSASDASRSSYSMSEMPDDYEERRLSYPSMGYVRSSNASHSAVYSANLPTPVFAEVTGHSPPKGGNGSGGEVMGFQPPRAPGLYTGGSRPDSHDSVNSVGASSINFFGEALNHPDFGRKLGSSTAPVKRMPTELGQQPQYQSSGLSVAESRAASSIYPDGESERGLSMGGPPTFPRGTDSFGFFGTTDRDVGNKTSPPRGNQDLGWFTRN